MGFIYLITNNINKKSMLEKPRSLLKKDGKNISQKVKEKNVK